VAVSVSVLGALVPLKPAVSHPDPVVYDTLAVSPLSVPPPPFVTDTVCGAGDAPLKLKVVFDTTMVGVVGAGVTVKVTFTVCGLLVVTGELTATVAVYVPAARLPVVAARLSVLGADVALRLALSHPAGWPAAKRTSAVRPERVPSPPFVTSTVCAAGFSPPAAPVKL
jgi:hypothetical protein